MSNSNILLYGKGVFTTIALIDARPFLWEKHWTRLTGNAEKLDIDISGLDPSSLLQQLREAVAAEGIRDGRARLTVFDETPSSIWGGEAAKGISISVVVGERRAVSDSVKLTTSPFRINSTSPLAGIKSCNYLEPVMAADEAKSRRFDEAIRLNERGEVTSASMANVFWLKDERLYTPSLSTGCLPGTTREFALENLVCEEVEAGIGALHEADEIFLTSAGIGVVQVAEFEGKKLGRTDHEILKVLPF